MTTHKSVGQKQHKSKGQGGCHSPFYLFGKSHSPMQRGRISDHQINFWFPPFLEVCVLERRMTTQRRRRKMTRHENIGGEKQQKEHIWGQGQGLAILGVMDLQYRGFWGLGFKGVEDLQQYHLEHLQMQILILQGFRDYGLGITG